MSLRTRLVAVAVLAIAALIVAAIALRDLARDGRAHREAVVAASNAQAARALDAALAELPPPGGDRADAAWRSELRARARDVLGPVFDTRGGYCFTDGTILEEEARSLRRGPPGSGSDEPPPGGPQREGPRSGPPPGPPGAPRFDDRRGPGLPPHPDAYDPGGLQRDAVGSTPPAMPGDVRAALLAACAREAPADAGSTRLDLGEDAMLISLAPDRGGVRGFALRFVHADVGATASGWSWRLFALAVITLALVAVTVDALLAVRRGASGLSRALSTIEADLRAEVPAVPGKEFADVARRIQRVATHLADARERERSLERKVAHDNRLASLGRVVAGVAHEVRNPLTGMKLVLDGLARRSLDARSAEDVDVCLSELARLEHLVTSLLGVARSGETGRFVQDIAGVVDERVAALRDVARERGVELERSGDARMFAVRDVLVRVIDNLLRNAIEASPRGGKVRVVISAVVRGDDEGMERGAVERVEIDVQDEGPGVSEAARDELFEPFRTTKSDGTGLGLWLSHTALTAQGATLDYRREGDVTHFVVGLPREPA